MAIAACVTATTKYGQLTGENSKNAALDYGYGFTSQIETQTIEASATAASNDVRSLLLEKINSPDVLLNSTSSYYNRVKEALEQTSNSFNNEVQYYIYDIDGYLVVSSCDDSTSDWDEVMTETVDSYEETEILSQSRFTADTLDIVSPIMVKNQIVGLLRSNVSVEYFGAFLSSESDNEKFVMDTEGNALFGQTLTSEDDQRFYDYLMQEMNTENLKEKSILNDSFSDTEDYIYGYASIPEYNWIYVIKQDTTGYTRIISSLPGIFMIILAVVIVLAILLSRSLTDRYTQPILELSKDMQRAADGNLDVHCTLEGADEFEGLASNFNHMMNIISTNYNEISDARQKLEASQLELQENYQKMEKLAYTDALTGLYNRMAFFKFAPEILAGDKRKLIPHAVVFIDLDGFKSINDTLGHDYGDLLLQAVSAQLSTYVDKDDILARNGGDEFVILRNHVSSHEDLENFLATLVSIASTPFVLDDETVHITLSAGAALFPQNGLSLNELMKNADIAMYTSKNSGKNSYTFFNSSMEDDMNRHNDLIDSENDF
jgi:diguanylate cyclase (GGDEF)-like protein